MTLTTITFNWLNISLIICLGLSSFGIASATDNSTGFTAVGCASLSAISLIVLNYQ